MIKTLIKFENLAVFLACLYFYRLLDASWLLFVLLWLLPDISMVGYLKDKKIGAVIYDAIHNYIIAFLIIFFGLWQGNNFIVSLGLILTSHIGLDRFLGYGLKYSSGFKDSHVQRV